MTSKTTFILIPGAWHAVSSLDPVATRLQAAGYKTKGVDLACFGAEPPVKDFNTDVDLIRNAIQEEVDRGQNVVVFMHSYGGVVGTEACRGFDKKTRKSQGKEGGVSHLIFCAAFLLPQGSI